MKATSPSVASMESRHTSRGNTLKNLLMFPKDKDEMKKESNIIYWYKCGRTKCDDEYIGESARTFEERFKEHLKAPSPIYEHDNINGHKTSVENFKIIGRGTWHFQNHQGGHIILESTSLLSTEMWANTACHTFGTKFCLPPQN